MKIKKGSRLMSYTLVFMMLVMTLNPVYAAEQTNFTDVEGHWAETEITQAHSEKLVEGYLDNTFQPDKEITMAEFITLMNRFLYLKEMGENNYIDVKETDWFSEETAKAKQINYIYGDYARPNESCKREEVVNALAELLDIQGKANTKTFNDLKGLSEESKQRINGLVEKGYITGYPDKTFKPQGTITRAEILRMFSNALGTIVWKNDALEGINEIEGNLTIVNAGIDLEGKKINGDLYISPGALDKINLKNLKVTGRIIISGGSETTPIKLDNVKAKEITIRKTTGKANIEITGKSEIEKITTKTEAEIEVKKGTTIKELDIQEQAAGTEITGDGEITKATIDAKDITIEQRVPQVEVTRNAKSAEIGGKETTSRNDNPRTSGGGSSSSSGSTPDTIAPTITVSGDGTVNTQDVDSWTTPTATVSDNKDTGLTATIAYYKADGMTTLADETVAKAELTAGRVIVIKYAAQDTAGNSANETVTITPVEMSGLGTSASPFRVESIEDLCAIGRIAPYSVYKHYKLMTNLNFGEASSYQSGSVDSSLTGGTGFAPIGGETHYFTGVFDGDNKTISNLFINSSDNKVGLFSQIGGGTVKNLNLANVNVTGVTLVGGLTGYSTKPDGVSSTIDNCSVTGTVSGNEFVGGLVGWGDDSTIEKSYAASKVSGVDYVGGLVGSYSSSTSNTLIKNSYATGDVTSSGGSAAVGGLVAMNVVIDGGTISTIENCYALGDVSETGGGASIGGLVGLNSGNGATINNCYALGVVNSKGDGSDVGGLVGTNDSNGSTVTNSIAFNSSVSGINGAAVRRVVVNYGTGAIANNYANDSMTATLNVSSIVLTKGNDKDDGADMTADEFKNAANVPLSSWDFTNIWEIKSGAERPTLKGVGNDNGSLTSATVAVTGVSLNKISTTLTVGDTETLIATVEPDNATIKNVSWLSSNPGVATVVNGQVTAEGVGTATITVTTADGYKIATCVVTVNVDDSKEAIEKIAAMAGKNNADNLTVNMLRTAGATDVVDAYLAAYKTSVVSDEAVDVDELIEIQALVDVVNAYKRVDETFTADATVNSGDTITLTVPTGYTAWFAPPKTDDGAFTVGSTMTTAVAGATSITAPTDSGTYKFYLIRESGVAYEGSSILTVSETDSKEAIEKIAAMAGNNNADTLTGDMIRTAGATDVVDAYLEAYKTSVVSDEAVDVDELIEIQALVDVVNAYKRVDETFTADATVNSGDTITLTVPTGYTAWFAPADTADDAFVKGSTMTTAVAGATSIIAPTDSGEYKFYLIGESGLAYEGSSILTVSETPIVYISGTGYDGGAGGAGIELSVETNKPGTAYYIVVKEETDADGYPITIPTPTKDQIKGGLIDGIATSTYGNITIEEANLISEGRYTKQTTFNENIVGLGTIYSIYLFYRDNIGNETDCSRIEVKVGTDGIPL